MVHNIVSLLNCFNIDLSHNIFLLRFYTPNLKSFGRKRMLREISYKEKDQQLKTIIFPNTVKYIGNYAFKGCCSLQLDYLPEGFLTIGFGYFSECTNLLMLQIPDSIMYINQEAFKRYKCLTSIYCIKLISIKLKINVFLNAKS